VAVVDPDGRLRYASHSHGERFEPGRYSVCARQLICTNKPDRSELRSLPLSIREGSLNGMNARFQVFRPKHLIQSKLPSFLLQKARFDSTASQVLR